MRNIIKIVPVIFLVFLAGCDGGSREDTPPDISLGQDPCDFCFMLINEKKFAAAIRLENGAFKRFDDIGCMIGYIEKKQARVKSLWVYDYPTGEPVRAGNALFIRTQDVITPMGSGILAFKSEREAYTAAERNHTQIESFNKLLTD